MGGTSVTFTDLPWIRDLARALLAQIHSAVLRIKSEDSPHTNTCVH